MNVKINIFLNYIIYLCNGNYIYKYKKYTKGEKQMEKEFTNQKLNVSGAEIAERMLFNNLFDDSKIYVFDTMDEEMEVYDSVNHAIKKTEEGDSLFIIPGKKSYNTNINPNDSFTDENGMTHKIYETNMNLWNNKNVIFDFIRDKDGKAQFVVSESNKLRGSAAVSTVEIGQNYRYIITFVSDILFKSPILVIKGNEKDVHTLLDNIEYWILDGNLGRILKEDSYVLTPDTTSINGDQMGITPIWQNITNIIESAANEVIEVNAYNEVVFYYNSLTHIKMEAEDDENGNIVTSIFVDDTLIYKSVKDSFERESINEEFMQQMVEQGIYRRDPENDAFYIDDEDGKNNILITITDNQIRVIGPEEGSRFQAIVTSKDMQFFSKGLTVMQNAYTYCDTFTFATESVVYYSDYSKDYLYYRDIFGVPYLKQ